MKILTDFIGSNIKIVSIEANKAVIAPDMRDSDCDWFYWAFCAEGCAGESVSFSFEKTAKLGRFGPAVSFDLKSWRWLGREDEFSFSYTFESSGRVYFAHDILYSALRFEEFANNAGLVVKTLCISEKGRRVPYAEFGEGENVVLLTARHHSCESSGSYVSEGVISGLKAALPTDLKVIAVPYVDYDGVYDGDQGKNRRPHDHNRDYTENSIYNTVRAVKKLTENKRVRYALDFHSPYHMGGRRDYPFIVHANDSKNTEIFSSLLEQTTKRLPIAYSKERDVAYGAEWNKKHDTPEKCSEYFSEQNGNLLSFTLENPYFGTENTPTDTEYYRDLGKCFAEALLLYHKSIEKIY